MKSSAPLPALTHADISLLESTTDEVEEFRILAHLVRLFNCNLMPRTVVAIQASCRIGGAKTKEVLKRLVQKGLVEQCQFTSEQAVSILKSKSPCLSGAAPQSADKCDWCNCPTYVLEQHHYPIPQSLGGKETVSICGSCHAEYHSLTGTSRYRFKGWNRGA